MPRNGPNTRPLLPSQTFSMRAIMAAILVSSPFVSIASEAFPELAASAHSTLEHVSKLAIAEAERMYGRGIPVDGVKKVTEHLAATVDLTILPTPAPGQRASPIQRAAALHTAISAMGTRRPIEYPAEYMLHPVQEQAPSFQNLSCLPLLPPGTHTSVSYSPPDDPDAKKKTDKIWNEILGAGMSGFAFDQTWQQLEPTKGGLNVSELAAVMQLLGQVGLHSIVNLPAIDTDTASVPRDLLDPDDPDRLRPGLAWNSTEVVTRYAIMLGQAVPLIVAHGGTHLGVGNEVDGTLEGMHPEHAVEYALFTYIARAVAHNITGGEGASRLSVGVTLTYGGLAAQGTRSSEWFAYLALPQVTDAIPVTYYPLQGNFSVQDPAVAVPRDLGALPSMLPGGRCVVMQELGFPSGYEPGHTPPSTDGSSQQMQADFFRLAFEQLAGPAVNGTGQVRFAGVDWLVDIPPATCKMLEKYYRVTVPAFVEYLCSLGVVGIDGQAKRGLAEVVEGVRRTERGSG